MDYIEEKDFENKEEVLREFINETIINKDEIKIIKAIKKTSYNAKRKMWFDS